MEVDPREYENITVCENDTHNLVLSYLVHNCFKETVVSFVNSTGMKQPENCIEEMERRKRILNCALDRNALKAIELTDQISPDILEKNKDLHFDLLRMHFVELICSKKCIEAVEFAQKNLALTGQDLALTGKKETYVKNLEDIMALVAYDEPEKSPMFHLVTPGYRQQVADSLNKAILAHTNLPSYSSLERLIQQTTIVTQHLIQDQGKDESSQFSFKDFIRS